MAKNPDHPKKPVKTPKSKAPNSKASRPDVQPIGPALAELLNPAINRGDAGLGSGTGLQPPPDNSWDRRSGGEAAAHRARASTRGTSEDVAKRDASLTGSTSRGSPPPNPPPQAGEGSRRLAPHADGKDFPAESQPASPLPLAGEGQGGGASTRQGFDEAPQANYGTAATIPALDPELARQLGFTTEEEDAAALARPPRNKTLAAQLYGEFKSFFPDNAVEYFVSYYDYYQPEAYVPRTDTYIEKDSSINEQIDRMRHSATRALLERDDVIIVASVSCIYGIGSVETYTAMTFALKKGERIDQRQLISDLVALQYKRTQADFTRGTFRVRGDVIDIFPAHYEDRAWRVNRFGDVVENIEEFAPLTGHKQDDLEFIKIYANSHYVTPRPTLVQAIKSIKLELKQRLDQLNNQGRLLEAQRLEQRTTFDLEMMEATGSCAGIENYSRYLTGRRPGEPPPTLFEYVPDNALVNKVGGGSPGRR